MNFRQKLIYMGFGASLIVLGMLLCSVFSPPLVALENGVFDTVVCKELAIVDKTGNVRIMLGMADKVVAITMHTETGKSNVFLSNGEEGPILSLKSPRGKSEVSLIVHNVAGGNLKTKDMTGRVTWSSPLR